MNKISIVIPIYNEVESLDQLYQELKSTLGKVNITYELIFVDDGSTDATFDLLSRLRGNDSNIKIIQFLQNFGKSQALSAGFDTASGDVVITIDADLQDNPEDIPKFLQKIQEGYDLVCAWRIKRQDPIPKILSSRFFNLITRFTTGIPLHDFNCGMKAYRREVLGVVTIYGELHRFIPVLVEARGFRLGEIKVHHRPREKGKSKFGVRRYLSGLLDLITVLFLTRFFKKPAHFFGGIALLLFSLGFLICLYISYLWFTFGDIQNRHPLLFLGVLLIIVAVQFFSTGLMGEMTTYTQRKKEKGYYIKRKLTD